MKSPKPKNSEDVHSGTAPFFQKQGAASLIGDDSFFTKSSGSQSDNIAVQKKCAACDEEDKVQKKEEPVVQKKADDEDATPPPPRVADQAKDATVPAAPAFHFIAEDNAAPEAGQMNKAAFMERLKAEVCEAVNSALAGTPFSSDNCPYIRASFAKHEGSSPAQIEALIIRYCPAAANARGAEEVIRQMKAKVYAAAVQWARNGGDLSGAAQIFGGIAGDINDAVGSVISGVSNAAGSVASGISNLFFKESAGGVAGTQSPQAVMQSLGKGSSIDSGTKSRMEGAFDSNFSSVEIHTDSNAAQLSKNMNARAFAVGNHIAFAGGEYQPGTLMGDALMAHELAHTIQQSDGRANGAQMKGSAYSALEEDADSAAVNVMSKLTGKEDGEFKGKVNKGLKTGLTISRCEGCSPSKPVPVPAPQKNMIDEIVDAPEKSDKGRVINVRDGINQNTFVQDLARIDILGEAGATPVKKKVAGKTTEVFEVNIFVTGLTEAWVKTKFNAIFPEGTEFTITSKADPKYTALRDLIAEYRAKHPNSFSKLQGHNQLTSSCSGACIGTFNRGVQNLYGGNTVNTGKDMDDTAFGTIDMLNKKGFVSKTNTIAATYDKSIRIPEKDEDITLSTSIGGEMNDIVQKEEDGVHPFLFSLGNGYHSITIIFYKMNGKTEIVWRDQHWEEAGHKAPKTVAEIDAEIKSYLTGRAKSWTREFYNRKNPHIDIYPKIPEGEKKEAAKKDAESTARKDLAVNRYGKLKPIDNK